MSEPGGVESTRDKILSAAVELTASGGWASLTMASLAARAGVSRQTVYNEFGNRERLGEAMVLRELAGFWLPVEDAFDAHPDDLLAAIHQAVESVLTAARDQPVLQAILSGGQGADVGLLPLLTTNAGELIELAKSMIRSRSVAYDLDMDDAARLATLDTIVRMIFSHLTTPAVEPGQAADDLTWVAGRLITFA